MFSTLNSRISERKLYPRRGLALRGKKKKKRTKVIGIVISMCVCVCGDIGNTSLILQKSHEALANAYFAADASTARNFNNARARGQSGGERKPPASCIEKCIAFKNFQFVATAIYSYQPSNVKENKNPQRAFSNLHGFARAAKFCSTRVEKVGAV